MHSTRIRIRPPRARAGFTLIELLGVIVILGILIVFLMPLLVGALRSAKVSTTKGFLQGLSAAITEYENEKGDYPASSWKDEWGPAPNATNIGAEALVIQLFGSKWQTSLKEDCLVNTDGDESRKALARFPKPTLFEIKDEWNNPIAYLHRRDYEHAQVYVMADPPGESTFKAHMNPTTGQYWEAKRFQLVSAGPDGEFGTGDDIPAWKEESQD
jgi:prepilin-type N-terminal cleavage/methylation domain-containing protein